MRIGQSICLLSLLLSLSLTTLPVCSQEGLFNGLSPEATARFFNADPKHPKDARQNAENGCQYGWYCLDHGYYDSAHETFAKAMRLDPTCACGYFGMARVGKVFQHDKESAQLYQEAIKLDPSLAGAEFKKKLEAPIPKSPRNERADAISAEKVGGEAFDRKNYKRALEFFEFAVKQDPTYAPGYFGSGHVYSAKKDFDSAAKFYRDALKYDPTYQPAHAGLAYVLLMKGHESQARKMLDEALKRDSREADVVLDFACYYADKGQWNTAKKYYLDALHRGASPTADIAKKFKEHGA